MRAYDPARRRGRRRRSFPASTCAPTPTTPRPAPTWSCCSPSGTSSAGSTSTVCATRWRRPRSSTPATCSTRPPCAAGASRTGRRAAIDGAHRRHRRSRASSARISATRCSRAATRSSRSTTCRPARRRTSRTSLDHARFTFVRADVCNEHPGRRATSTACCTSRARRARPSTSRMPLETLDVSSLGTRRALDLALRERRAVPPRVDERGLRRPARAPADRGVLRQRQPGRPARGVRRGQALRGDAHDDVPPAVRPADARSCASSTPTARACARPTAASCRTSSCRRSTGKPITMYGDGSQTRSFCYVADEVRGHHRALRLRRRSVR